jgi:hypothetical protein
MSDDYNSRGLVFICLTLSKKHTAAAAAAFNDSMPPDMGMIMCSVLACSIASDKPVPSLPNTNAAGPVNRI